VKRDATHSNFSALRGEHIQDRMSETAKCFTDNHGCFSFLCLVFYFKSIAKRMPILLHGLEACALNKSAINHIASLDFVLNTHETV